MFACDQLHTDNISRIHLYWQVVCIVFHNIVKIGTCSPLSLHIHGYKTTTFGGNGYASKNKIWNPPAPDHDQLFHQSPWPHAPGPGLYNVPHPFSLTPTLLPLPRKPKPLQGVQIDEIRDETDLLFHNVVKQITLRLKGMILQTGCFLKSYLL
jgi:hypothetical protein